MIADLPSMASPAVDTLLHVLLALAAVIAVGRCLALALAYVSQPPVIGEVLAGIVLGPSLLGLISPRASAFIFPESALPALRTIAQFGVILYMFLIGLDLNADLIRQRIRATALISCAGILAPFALGLALAAGLYPSLAGDAVPLSSFALFVGVAMAITAFPVLARILTDRRLQHTELGVTALTSAAMADVIAWCLLAFVVGVAQAKLGAALLVTLWTAIYIAFMFLAVRPLVARLLAHGNKLSPSPAALALVFLGLLASAALTEWIGIHLLFGAFLFGVVVPHDSGVAQRLTHALQKPVTVLLLPAFFALTGMRTQIGLMTGWQDWLVCSLIVVAATAGKFGGTWAAARLTGLDSRTATAMGALMNTRGLMELIVLNVGLDLGVISPTLFAMMVLMALATTMATTPIVKLLRVRPPAAQVG